MTKRFEALLVGRVIKVWDRGKNVLVETYPSTLKGQEQAIAHANMLNRNRNSVAA